MTILPRTRQIAAGDYVLVFRLGAETASARIHIAKEPDTLTPEQDFARAMARASYSLATAAPDGAVSALGDLLGRQPNNITALVLQGDILRSHGQNDRASAAYAQPWPGLQHAPGWRQTRASYAIAPPSDHNVLMRKPAVRCFRAMTVSTRNRRV